MAADEVLVDTRTILSTNVGVERYLAYLTRAPLAETLFKDLGYLKSAWATILAFPRICRAIGEAWRMKKRWPWIPPRSFRTRSLADLREEFGIRVI